MLCKRLSLVDRTDAIYFTLRLGYPYTVPIRSSTLLKWVSGSIAAGLLWDALKVTFVSSGFEKLLPELAFLVKPIMVVVGVALGGTVLTVSIRDFLKRNAERKESKRKERLIREREAQRRRDEETKFEAEKEKQLVKSSIPKLDWLIDYHAPKFELGKVTDAGTNERASLYVDDLLAARLVHPKLSDRIKNRSPQGNYIDTSVLDHLPVVRERLVHRGLDDARRTVKQWPILVPVHPSAD